MDPSGPPSLSPSSSMPSIASPAAVRPRHAPVPLLLESFPTPPSFIPPTPGTSSPANLASPSGQPPAASPNHTATTFNPPPTAPPSTPLPPVPGTSRISDVESRSILSASRRSSKYSTSSTSPRPPSVATSVASHDSSLNRRDSLASSTSSSLRRPSFGRPLEKSSPRPSLCHSIAESTTSSSRAQPAPVPQPDVETESPSRGPNDSISSISMDDLPPAEDLDDMPTTTPQKQMDHQIFHLHLRSARSRSKSHRQSLQNRSASPGRLLEEVAAMSSNSPSPRLSSPRQSREQRAAPRPQRAPSTTERAGSPDISTIISRTPRPRRSLSSVKSRSLSRPRQSRSLRRTSDGTSTTGANHSNKSSSMISSRSSTPGRSVWSMAYDYNHDSGEPWEEEDFIERYGVGAPCRLSNGTNEEECEDEQRVLKLERELDGEGSDTGSDSDSSLDLHTPLPNLMVKHGLLSPNSKLLSMSSPSLVGLASQTADGRPGSVFSVADSVMTKSGIIKDARDTPRRRVRHRDGSLLKGGLGLTTGLGWSDSEDEDAPSPLTRRLSSMSLSRQSSMSSLRTRASSQHPLSRSFSQEPPSSKQDIKRKTSLPANEWWREALPLNMSIPEETEHLRVDRRSAMSEPDPVDLLRTPSSTASSLSIPMPRTPSEDDQAASVVNSKLLGANGHRLLSKEKSLPSLPNPRTGSIRYGNNTRFQPKTPTASVATARPRTLSVPSADRPDDERPPALPSGLPTRIGPSAWNGPAPSTRGTKSVPSTPSTTHLPRPLHLPLREPSPQPPRVPKSPTTPGALSTSTSTPTMGGSVRGKPRTGTGMVYRSSASSSLPSRSRTSLVQGSRA